MIEKYCKVCGKKMFGSFSDYSHDVNTGKPNIYWRCPDNHATSFETDLKGNIIPYESKGVDYGSIF